MEAPLTGVALGEGAIRPAVRRAIRDAPVKAPEMFTLPEPKSGHVVVAGTPAIAALGALYAVGFFYPERKLRTPGLLPALRAVRLNCGCMIDTDKENGREHSTHQPDRLTQNS